MKYCKKCLQPDTNPVILLDEKEVCYACRYEESKKDIDWEARELQLKKIAEEAKTKAKEQGQSYDCVIGVSGGKDSTFQAVYAKEKLGLRPLLVNGAPDNITEIGEKNIVNLNRLGFDIISIHPNPNSIRYLTKKLFIERGNLAAGYEYSLVASTFIIANVFNIPLIIHGENPNLTKGITKVGDKTDSAYGMANCDILKGKNAIDIVNEDNISIDDVYFSQIPNLEEMKAKGIKAIWLQYYTREWSQVGNADFAIARGLVGRTDVDLHEIGHYRPYSCLDSDLFIPNQMIKYLKFGYGFATDQACYDIREGRLSREDAKWYVKEYDGKCGEQYIEQACKYLNMTKEEFWEVVDKFVNYDLFNKVGMGKYVPKFSVGVDFE